LEFVARIAESRWLTKNFSIHAMMDLSDGLGADLPRLARASKVRFDVDLERLPVARGATTDNAISEGEDYELLFAISPRDRNRLERDWRRKFPKLLLTRIGSLNRKSRIPDAKGQTDLPIGYRKLPRGYVHFQQPR
jgi:thiamine-monophosphate kinase